MDQALRTGEQGGYTFTWAKWEAHYRTCTTKCS